MNPRLAALVSIIAQSVHFRTQPKAMRSIARRLPRQYGHGAGSGKRASARLQRQIDKGMLSIGSKGFCAPLTRAQVGL